METPVKKKPYMKGLIAPLQRQALTQEQREWKQRATESMAKILATGYNQRSKVRG